MLKILDEASDVEWRGLEKAEARWKVSRSGNYKQRLVKP